MIHTPKKLSSVEEQKLQQKKKEETRIMDDQLKVYVHQRGAVKGKLTRVRNALQHSEDDPNPNIANVHFLRAHLRTVETCYSEFNDLQNKIYALPLSDERRSEQEDKYIEFESLHTDLNIRINILLENATKPDVTQLPAPGGAPTIATPVQTYLPPLQAPLPTFDGSYDKWFSFKSMFTTIMNRYKHEEPAIKLFHLRNALVGAASGIIDQDIVNNNDYDAAWKFLTDRYEDRRLIMDKHIEALTNLPKVAKESSKDMRKLIDTCTKNVEALKNLALPVAGLGEQILLHQITSKLDKSTRVAWEGRQKKGVFPKYDATIDFLQEQCRIMEKIDINTKSTMESAKVKTVNKTHSLVVTNEHKKDNKCSLCKNNHELWRCDQFKQMSVSDKYSALKKLGSCFNCLQRGHRTTVCPSSHNCRDCGKRHHTLVHNDGSSNVATMEPVGKPNNETQPKAASNKNPEITASESATTLCSSTTSSSKQTLLSTAIVMVHGSRSAVYPCRALLDSASQTHFVTERLANLLSQRKEPVDYLVSGLNDSNTRLRHRIRTTVKSLDGSFATELDFLIAPRITGDVPVKTLDVSGWPIPDEIKLADPTFHQKGRIDMLIGAGIFWDLLKNDRIRLAPNLPVLTNTEFGWIVGGVIDEEGPVIARSFCQTTGEERLEDLLRSFYRLESCDEFQTTTTKSDEECLDHFKQTHYRDEQGRYFVRHPFNPRKDQLGDSLDMATRRFLNLERRLDRQPELKAQYSNFLDEYARLGHMQPIVVDQNADPASMFFLPHHCVLKPTSTTTKLRVVFDGSAKSSTGVSINDTLEAGPVVQRDLTSILINFRGFRYVLTVDVPMMFRQVGVAPPDTRYQLILWRKNNDEPLTVWELRTVTYGLAPSPFQATMALNQVADDHREDFPEAACAIKKGAYMDDVLTGANTLPEICKLQEDVTSLLSKGCFGTHKWCSNAKAVMDHVSDESRGIDFEVNGDNLNTTVKTLGVIWNPREDWFSFRVPVGDPDTCTRRQILSEVARIFDPLGMIGPVITSAKLILREVSLLQTDWDDPVPQDLLQVWRSFRSELVQLNELQVPRWVSTDGATAVELHGFSDASDHAYGACVYTRVVRDGAEATMHLVSSKSRILPKKTGKSKPISTPRAELLAAVQLSKLIDKVLHAIDLKVESVNLWTDSKIVYCWIKKPPQTLQIYVSNRVAEIQRLTGHFRWRHIPTNENPADYISRGQRPRDLMRNEIWWKGPPMLRTMTETDEEPELPDEELPELRISLATTTTTPKRMEIFDRLSSFDAVLQSMAYVVRFARYIISKRKSITKGPLTSTERAQALILVVRLVQEECFQPEIQALRKNSKTRHRLCGLKPFLDPMDGVLRVGGRIKHAFIPYDSRHQMLLPAKHPLTDAMIRSQHRTNLHIGQKGLLAIIRQRFWPLNVKTTIRKVIRSCTTCFKANPMKTVQLMGDLPSYRVRPAPTFSNTGVDFAGPFLVKSTSVGRKPLITKSYVCLFVCMLTRAIHIELVSDLTTEAFLAALRRFTSRRGVPNRMFSDNATNFVGAQNELERLAQMFKDQHESRKIVDFCCKLGFEWSFIPPRSPHFGGIWEAGVKQVKYHLTRVVGDRKLTYEELYTTLTQIEAVLNSRPLAPSSDDPNDFSAITPAHFLIGREMQAVAEPSYLNIRESKLSRWQLIQTMLQHFWKRWISECLPELQIRSKWLKRKDIPLGALVLIVDQNAPPLHWQLGRITAIHPGPDGVTRVVSLRTSKGDYKRAVSEICLLPLEMDKED